VGDWVIAIGNPFGLGGTATTGIISARGRDINAGPYDDYIQIDAPINRGNSGGPLFDTSGLVIGVNTAIYSPSGGNVGIGFAVPAEQAEKIIAQLRDRGVVLRAWLGVHIQRVTPDLAESFGLDKSRGALVSKVEPDSPAENAGIVPGDIILGFDGNTVDRMKRLPRLVASATIGDKVGISIWRDGREITLYPVMQPTGNTSQIAAYSSQRDHGPLNLGLLLSALDHDTRQRYGIGADAAGILVEQVKPGSPAADKGLKRGDLIVQVERRPVDTPARMTELVHTAYQNNQKVVLLLIQRKDQQHFVTLRLA
jgi:serine protease Do